MADQILKCVGELQVISPSSYEYSKGTIRFIGPFNSDLGQIRASGFGGFGVMIADVSGLSSGGFNVRTSNNQGDSSVGGGGDPYPFTVQGSTTTIVNATVGPRNSNNPQATPVLNVQRPLSSTSTFNQSELAQFFQNTIRQGESVHIKVGGGFSALQGFFGATYPDGDSSSSINSRVYLGVRTSTSTAVNKALTIDKDGNVNIPLKLTATTIQATNYIGLPSQNLDPLTLDPTNNLVGVNTATPQHTLDVNGDSIFRSTVLVPETSGVEISGLLKVSHATGKVDIDTPKIIINSTTGDIGVIGTINTDHISAVTMNASTSFQMNEPVSGSPVVQMFTSGQEKGVSIGADKQDPAYILEVTGSTNISSKLKADTVEATTYLNLPTANVAPITLDTTNSRVGINKTTPTEALDVTGNIHATGSILGTQLEADDVLATNITTSTINAGTYLNLPEADLIPITLDKTNNRVGINKADPTQALHVVGNVLASGSVTASTGVFPSATVSASIQSGTGSPTNVVSSNVGSLFLRSDGSGSTALYVKGSGTDSTGWQTFITTPTTAQYVSSFVSGTVNANISTAPQNLCSVVIPFNGVYMVTAYLDMRAVTTAYDTEFTTTYGVYTTNNGVGTTTGTGFNKAQTFYNKGLGTLSGKYRCETFSFFAVNNSGSRTIYLNTANNNVVTWTSGQVVYGSGTGIVAYRLNIM